MLLMLLIGWAFGNGQPLFVRIGVVDNDRSPLSDSLVGALRRHTGVRVSTGSQRGELRALKAGDRRLVIVIPEGFEATTVGYDTTLVVYTDRADPENTRLASTVLQSTLVDLASSQEAPTPFAISERAVSGGLRLNYLDFLVPGVLGLATQNIAMDMAITALVPYRTSGLLRRIRATPLPLYMFVGGASVSSLILAIMQVFLVMGTALAVFHVRMLGSVWSVILIVVAGNAVFVVLGIVIASIANTYQSAQVLNFAFVLPMMFLSGTFFQTEAMPAPIRSLVSVLPLTHLVTALRAVAIRGAGLGSVASDLAILGAVGAVLFVVAILVFRWE